MCHIYGDRAKTRKMYQFIKKQNGYSFLDAILQLAVIVFAVQASVLLMLYMMPYKSESAIQHMRWEVFIADMQKYIASAQGITIQSEGEELIIEDRDSLRFVSQSKETIRVRLNTGNEILFVGIQDLQFKEQGEQIIVQATFIDGSIKERAFVVDMER